MGWVNNFKNSEEKFLASCILDSIIFRNKSAMSAFSSQIFHIILPQLLSEKNIYEIESLSQWENDLMSSKARSIFPFRFTTIEGVDKKTGKSGQSLIRDVQREFFDKELNLSIYTLTDPEFIKKAKNAFNTIIILDDVQVTGSQFTDFIETFNLTESPFQYIYIPYAAFEDSINELNSKYNNIDIKPVEVLSKEHSFFSEKNEAFGTNDEELAENLKSMYLNICEKYGINVKEPLGFGDHALTYIFNNSTPNNNLPLLSYNGDNWNKLFTR
ncbi:phosphoribosyltransferase-like protein [Photobacterium damselae]|uniref:phosphoribosyltransferase-like protein n=1 Tax=Photobacterium damselae TaxID=38293 RepID=UPI004068D942